MRSFNRQDDEMRPIDMVTRFTKNAHGSVLASFGDTSVLCTATLEERIPHFLKGRGQGWLTAEYGMLPGSTNSRSPREAARGKQTGRTVEIQRLIGRSLRMCLDLKKLGERTINIDCDVINADGGTRTTAISGSWVATILCLWHFQKRFEAPIVNRGIAALSVGLRNSRVLVDLDYAEDSNTDVDLNLVMTHDHRVVEVQGTAEGAPFGVDQLNNMIMTCGPSIDDIKQAQIDALLEAGVDPKWIP